MSRRFSDEPINLIHRIPTPEQLSAARPSKRSLGQIIMELGASCARGIADVLFQVARVGRGTPMPLDTTAERPVIHHTQGPISVLADPLNDGGKHSGGLRPRTPAVESAGDENRVNPSASTSKQVAVQPEEVAELRAYVLSQQQDIARLTAHVQELKSMVVSQQQVLVYLGKEFEAGSLSSMATGIASAPAKRNRPIREKPGMKDKAVVRKDAPNPSLSL